MKALFAALGLFAFTLPALAADTDRTAAEIAALREEVTALRSNVMSLNIKLADMQAMLRDMNAMMLKTRNETLEAQVAARSKGGDQECTTKLEGYKTKRDKLIALGYKPEHPDLRNLGTAIEQLEAKCGTEKASTPQ